MRAEYTRNDATARVYMISGTATRAREDAEVKVMDGKKNFKTFEVHGHPNESAVRRQGSS